MMRDIAARARAEIKLLQTAEHIAQRTKQRPIARAETLLAQ